MARHQTISILYAALLLVCGSAASWAQNAPAPKSKPGPNTYGSPLDTLMSTHLWTDVPPARDFVKESRPDVKTLDYAPLTGKDPERPKPRDKAAIQALRAELEADGAKNEKKARGLRGHLAPAAHHAKRAAAGDR